MVSVFCAALAAVHKWGLLGVEHPGQEREKGLVFPNFSDRGSGGGHLYPAGEPLTFSRNLGWF